MARRLKSSQSLRIVELRGDAGRWILSHVTLQYILWLHPLCYFIVISPSNNSIIRYLLPVSVMVFGGRVPVSHDTRLLLGGQPTIWFFDSPLQPCERNLVNNSRADQQLRPSTSRVTFRAIIPPLGVVSQSSHASCLRFRNLRSPL
jgi:hypothetical protein